MKSKIILLTLTLTIWLTSSNIVISHPDEQIKWMSLDEAVKAAKKENKKVIVDMYTKWCGWCKVMDQKTYSDINIIRYINSHYYAVKMDAESKDTLTFQNMKFGFNETKRSNELAYSLLNGKMSYPTTVILNGNAEILTPVQGYVESPTMMKILKFYGENIHTKMSWEEYEKIK